jgi:tetratricopeptide (TPR) repeat protein
MANKCWLRKTLIAGLLAILMFELYYPAAHQAQTPDEANHILSGVRSWKFGDFGTNPEHPPLAKLVAALPLLRYPCPPLQPYTYYFKSENFKTGAEFLYSHDADFMLLRARMLVSVFSLGLAIIVLQAGTEMFCSRVGILALALYVFDPNLLAHGSLVTTDMAVTCLYFGSTYAFYRWCVKRTFGRLAFVGAVAGLTLAAKHSGLFVIPMLSLLAVIEMVCSRYHDKPNRLFSKAMNMTAGLVLIITIAFGTLWGVYGFRYTSRPNGMTMFPSLGEYITKLQNPIVSAAISVASTWHIMPEAYLYGIADIASAMKRDPMYLFGQDFATGHWFYFPAVFAIKTTLGMLGLLAIALFLRGLRQSQYSRAICFLVIPPSLYFCACLCSAMNLGVRHILPIYPFLHVLAAATASMLIQKGGAQKVIAIILLTAHIVSSILSFPHYIPYANEASGGDSNTFRLLSDSNSDWGQGLREVKQYLEMNGIRDCWFAHYGMNVNPSYYNIPCRPLPEAMNHMYNLGLPMVPETIEGTILVSGSEADGFFWGPGDLNPYAQFLHHCPDAIIADSILVFRGTFHVPELAAYSHLSLAKTLATSQQWDLSLRQVQIALELSPKLSEAYVVQSRILNAMNRRREAESAFRQALDLADTDNPEYVYPRILHIPVEYLH